MTSLVKNRKFLIGAAFVLLVLIGVGLRIRAKRQDAGVLSDPIKKGSIIESVYGIGMVTATKSFQLKSGVTGNILKIFVKEGDLVKRGSPIVDLEGVFFRAPFDGTITSLPFKVGEAVFVQSVVYTLVDLLDRYLVVSLEQRGALRVRRGQKAKLSFETIRDESYEGTVESVYSNDGNFLVRIDVSKLPAQILPGMTADVAIGVDEHKDILLAPAAAIESGIVHVKRGFGGPTPVSVKVGIVDGAMAEIVSGDLHEGERLLIRKKAAP
jgi:multidrug efflux pump subunit AcrA (membrane-fusion protein)